jgi:acetyl-CoA carboxylase / biotin carboxylase 1
MAPAEVNGTAHVNGVSKSATKPSKYAKDQLPSHFIGGNHLNAAPPSKVKDFVAAHDGHTVITSVSFF